MILHKISWQKKTGMMKETGSSAEIGAKIF